MDLIAGGPTGTPCCASCRNIVSAQLTAHSKFRRDGTEKLSTINEVWTPRMSEPSNPLRLKVVGALRNGRRRYDPASKRRLVGACLQLGVSLAGVAMQHGVNANLLRKWVAPWNRDRPCRGR